MLNASDIQYQVNKSKGIVVATISGTKYDAIDSLIKVFKRVNLPFNDWEVECVNQDTSKADAVLVQLSHKTSCTNYLIPDTFEGVAHYNPEDPHPFDVETGMTLAKYRLYKAYNSALFKALHCLTEAIVDVSLDVTYHANEVQDRLEYNIDQLDLYKGGTQSNGSVGL